MMKIWLLVAACFLCGNVKAQYIPRFEIQGHGANAFYPDNTIPGFLKALELGVTAIDIDVVITKDKQVVVSNEPWIEASLCLSPSGEPITESEQKKLNIYKLSYEELTQYDCGSKLNPRFPQQQKYPGPKPLLVDVIVAVEQHLRSYTLYEIDYNIEIKSSTQSDKVFHPGVEEYSDLVYQLIDQYLPLERVVIQSFDNRVLKYWKQKYPEVRLSLLVNNMKSIDANLQVLGFSPSIYSPDYRMLTREKVQYLQKKKIRVIPWGINEEAEMLAYKGMGVDGFITDYPDKARKYKMTLNIRPR